MPGNRTQVRFPNRVLTPITGPSGGSYHSNEAIPVMIKLSATEGNYFGSNKATSAGSSSNAVQERSCKGFSTIMRVAETIQVKEEVVEKSSAASGKWEAILDQGERKSVRIKEEVLIESSIEVSVAATRSVKCYFTPQFFGIFLGVNGASVL